MNDSDIILLFERCRILQAFPVNSFLTILFPLGLSDLGIYSYCTSISTYRHSRCDYNVLHELVPIVLFKKSIVILETDLRREKIKG